VSLALKATLAAGSIACAGHAFGEVIFDVNPNPSGNNGFIQQSGNNRAYYGESVQLLPSAPRLLETIKIAFTYFEFESPQYTPHLRVDLWNVDANGLPVDSDSSDNLSYTPIASVTRTDVTFTGSNYNGGGGVRDVQQDVTFNFLSQNIMLPDRFAFGYRDENPDGLVSPAFNFSVFASSAPNSDEDSAGGFIIEAGPNYLPATTFEGGGGTYSLESEVTAIPEPHGWTAVAAAAALLPLGWHRRRRQIQKRV
jgi:hypothetical protein